MYLPVIVELLSYLLVIRVMVYGIFEGVSGRRVGVVQALSRGVKALFPALGIVIITAIVWWLHGALLAAIFGGFGNFTVVES